MMPGRRPVTILVALATFAAAVAFAWSTFSVRFQAPERSTATTAPSGLPARVDLSDIPEGWTELPAPPEIRTGAAQVWSGSALFIWGGWSSGSDEVPPERDGLAFDLSSNMWTTIPPAPISGRSFPAAAWTGRELLVWGGWDGSWSDPPEEEPRTFSDGAAYDPATKRWRILPESRLSARAPLSAWTGEELIVWGTSLRTADRPLDGAAYDPASASWRRIADGPIELTDAVGVWTGTEMIVFGAALHGGNFPETPTAIGAAYDPESDTWRQLPDSDLDPNANTAGWLVDRLIAWDYSEHTSAYSPETDAWSRLAGPPVDACEDVPSSVTADGFLFGELCAELVVMLPGEDRWHNVTRRDLPFWAAEFVAVEDLAFVLGYDRLDDGSPRMFAFRPPSSFHCGGFPGIDGAELAAAVAARFELLRSDRPETLVRPELDALLSRAGASAFEDPSSGAGGLFAPVALDRIQSIEELPDSDGFRVGVRLYNLGGEDKLAEELTLRQGVNLSGDDCPLVVDDVHAIGLQQA